MLFYKKAYRFEITNGLINIYVNILDKMITLVTIMLFINLCFNSMFLHAYKVVLMANDPEGWERISHFTFE